MAKKRFKDKDLHVHGVPNAVEAAGRAIEYAEVTNYLYHYRAISTINRSRLAVRGKLCTDA
ncbi:MAG: hypothetical protein AAF557_19955 [Pseudomonadota bacterium]